MSAFVVVGMSFSFSTIPFSQSLWCTFRSSSLLDVLMCSPDVYGSHASKLDWDPLIKRCRFRLYGSIIWDLRRKRTPHSEPVESLDVTFFAEEANVRTRGEPECHSFCGGNKRTPHLEPVQSRDVTSVLQISILLRSRILLQVQRDFRTWRIHKHVTERSRKRSVDLEQEKRPEVHERTTPYFCIQ